MNRKMLRRVIGTAAIVLFLSVIVALGRRWWWSQACWFDYDNPASVWLNAEFRKTLRKIFPLRCNGFRCKWFHEDMGAYIFSAECAHNTSVESIFVTLERGLPAFRTIKKTESTIVLRREAGRNIDLRLSGLRFDEWHVIVDTEYAVITALFWNIEKDEIRCYEALLRKFRQLHEEEVARIRAMRSEEPVHKNAE